MQASIKNIRKKTGRMGRKNRKALTMYTTAFIR